jgi:hypothetical protein
MYEVDELDRVIELRDLPPSDSGAPGPHLLGHERSVILAYYIRQKGIWQMPSAELARMQDFREEAAIIKFNMCFAQMFGPPNDEAFAGHPLASRGLAPYGIFRIESSSWIRKLERMNSVHPSHKPERYAQLQHLVFAFHDSTFECVCKAYDVAVRRGPISSLVPEMAKLLN